MLQNEFTLINKDENFLQSTLHFWKNFICFLYALVLIAQTFLSNDVCRNCLRVDMQLSQTYLKQKKYESG